MSFVPIYTTHSPQISFAFTLHLFCSAWLFQLWQRFLGGQGVMTMLSWPLSSLTHVIYAVKHRICGKTGTHRLFPHSGYCRGCGRMQFQLQLWEAVADFGSPQQLMFSFRKWEISKSGLRYFLCLSWNVAQHTRLFCSVWPFESLCEEIKKPLCVLTLHTVHFCQGPTCLTLLWVTVVLIQPWPGNTYASGKADALSCLSL